MIKVFFNKQVASRLAVWQFCRGIEPALMCRKSKVCCEWLAALEGTELPSEVNLSQQLLHPASLDPLEASIISEQKIDAKLVWRRAILWLSDIAADRYTPAKLRVFPPIFAKMADLAGCSWLLKLATAKIQTGRNTFTLLCTCVEGNRQVYTIRAVEIHSWLPINEMLLTWQLQI